MIVRCTIFVDFIVRCGILIKSGGRELPGNGNLRLQVWEKEFQSMVKIEDIQNYGKEHFESVTASANNLQSGVQAIANAYGDTARVVG